MREDDDNSRERERVWEKESEIERERERERERDSQLERDGQRSTQAKEFRVQDNMHSLLPFDLKDRIGSQVRRPWTTSSWRWRLLKYCQLSKINETNEILMEVKR